MREALLVAALVLGTTIARASDGAFYVGAGVTTNKLSDISVPGSFVSPSIDATSWKAFAVFRPISLFAVEADFNDMGGQSQLVLESPQSCISGGFCSISYNAHAKALAVYAVGFLPIPVPALDIYGKIGAARYDLTGNVTYVTSATGSAAIPLPGTSTELAWGAGLQLHFGKFGGRLEYEGIDKANTQVFSLSILVNLL